LGAGANSDSAVAITKVCLHDSPAAAIALNVPARSHAMSNPAASLEELGGGSGSILMSKGFPSRLKKYFNFG